MLPVYKAISLEQPAISGGTTHPCIVQAVDGAGRSVAAQVVKPFQYDHREAILPEVLGNVLAQEFDLRVPPAALVELDIDFLALLREHPIYRQKHLEPGFYFATELLTGGLDYLPAMHQPRLPNDIIEKIFAFDVLIRNPDRRAGKPNFFIHGGEPLLIDHELSLIIPSPLVIQLENDLWGFMQDRPHIFLDLLRKNSINSQPDFGEFFEYLRTLNLKSYFPTQNNLQSMIIIQVEYT